MFGTDERTGKSGRASDAREGIQELVSSQVLVLERWRFKIVPLSFFFLSFSAYYYDTARRGTAASSGCSPTYSARSRVCTCV